VTLVDTSVWVEHLRRGSARLARLLGDAQVLCHPFIIGEIACGRLTDRGEVLGLLAALPHVPEVEHDEVLAFLERHHLAGIGLGWIDVHLLAAAALARASLWTLDRALAVAAAKLRLP